MGAREDAERKADAFKRAYDGEQVARPQRPETAAMASPTVSRPTFTERRNPTTGYTIAFRGCEGE